MDKPVFEIKFDCDFLIGICVVVLVAVATGGTCYGCSLEHARKMRTPVETVEAR